MSKTFVGNRPSKSGQKKKEVDVDSINLQDNEQEQKDFHQHITSKKGKKAGDKDTKH